MSFIDWPSFIVGALFGFFLTGIVAYLLIEQALRR
jgi:hypothetical protein